MTFNLEQYLRAAIVTIPEGVSDEEILKVVGALLAEFRESRRRVNPYD